MEDTWEIDEAGIFGCWSHDDDSGVDNSEARGSECVEGDHVRVDAEFLPLDSACDEHTCPWNFAGGGRDLGPSNVKLRKFLQA